MRSLVAVSIALCAAVAPPARADHGYGQQLDDVDDEPFAQELRAAFGARISTCSSDGTCALSLSQLTCKGTVCRARDAAHGGAKLVARGAAAKTVREHLIDLGSDHFEAGRAAAWHVECSAQASTGQKIRHGHCHVQLGDGDPELADQVGAMGSEKLGGVWWSGDVIVECTDWMCHASCAPEHLYHQYQDCENAAHDFPRPQAFAQAVMRRGGGSAALISCGGWRNQGWDGGLVDVMGCKVAPKPAPPPVPRPWAALVRAGAKWELEGADGEHLVVETDDVRAVGDAQVARLRWRIDGTDYAGRAAGRPAQVAVTKAGIWFLDGGDDDAAVAHELAATPPTFADPPALTPPSADDFARVWHTGAGDAFCVGHAPQPDEEMTVACFAPGAGPVLLGGHFAPHRTGFAQAGWTDTP